MTLTTTSQRNEYPGTGSVGPFAYNFRIFAATDLVVDVVADDGISTRLIYPDDYAVSGVGNIGGGSITLVDVLSPDETLLIRRIRPLTQTTSLRSQAGRFLPEVHEDTFDHLMMVSQQLQEQLDRTFKLPPVVDATVYDRELRVLPGQALFWDAAGLGIESRAIDSAGSVALPGNGRITETLSDYLENNQVFLVDDYGALPNNLDDATVAFQEAATAAGLVGGAVLARGGAAAYRVLGQVTIPANVKVYLRGATVDVAHANPFLLDDGAEIHGGTITWSVATPLNAVSPGDRSKIFHTRFVGGGAIGVAGTPLYQRGIFGTTATNVSVMFCSFESMTVGVWSGPSSVDPTPTGWRVIGNVFENIVGFRGESEGYGCLFTPSSDGVLAHNVFKNIARHAIYLAGGACRNVVASNTIDGVDNVGIQLNCNLAQPAQEDNIIAQNVISNVTKSIAYGYRSATGIGVYGNNVGTLVSANRISKYLDTGIDFGSPSQDHPAGCVGHGYMAIGNFVDGSLQSDACIRTDNPDDCDIRDNSLVASNNTYGIVAGGAFAPTTGRKSRYRRNEIITLGAGSVGVRIATTGSVTEFTNNDVSGPGVRIDAGGAALFVLDDYPGYLGIGDNDYSYLPGRSPQNLQQTTALTGNRTITLVRLGARAGSRVRVARPSAGAFTCTVQDEFAAAAKALATGQWVDFVFDGGQWVEAGFGTL